MGFLLSKIEACWAYMVIAELVKNLRELGILQKFLS